MVRDIWRVPRGRCVDCLGNLRSSCWRLSRDSLDDRRVRCPPRVRGLSREKIRLFNWSRLSLWDGCRLLMACGHTRSLGDPKRKVWWVQQQDFPSERNQGLIGPVGGRNHFWRCRWLTLAGRTTGVNNERGTYTQHNQAILPQRNSEVVNLTCLAENKGLDV
jgi:hypothetical protein